MRVMLWIIILALAIPLIIALIKALIGTSTNRKEIIDEIIASLLTSDIKEAYYNEAKIQKVENEKKTMIIVHDDIRINKEEIEKMSKHRLVNKAKLEEPHPFGTKTILTFVKVKDSVLSQEAKKQKETKPRQTEKNPVPKPSNSPEVKYPEIRKIKTEIEKVRKEKQLSLEIQHELNQIENSYIPKLIRLLEENRIKKNEFSNLTTTMNNFVKKVKNQQEVDVEVEAFKNFINKKYGSRETTNPVEKNKKSSDIISKNLNRRNK